MVVSKEPFPGRLLTEPLRNSVRRLLFRLSGLLSASVSTPFAQTPVPYISVGLLLCPSVSFLWQENVNQEQKPFPESLNFFLFVKNPL